MRYTGFLCGGFTLAGNAPAPSDVDGAWRRIEKNKGEIEEFESFYYPDFVAFNYGDGRRGMARYSLDVSRDVRVCAFGCEYGVTVRSVSLFVAPYRLMLFAVHVEQSSGDANDFTAVMSVLRNVGEYDPVAVGGFIDAALAPVARLYDAMAGQRAGAAGYRPLVENGNKLKIFQIVELDDPEWQAADTDRLLFETAMLMRVGSSAVSSSPEYFGRIMGNNRISIYNNWKALALFDTFTMLGHDVPDWLRQNWIDNYFNMIYVSLLFNKLYLFRLNILFRKRLRKIDRLEREFDEFERTCRFAKISYNFMPLEICDGINRGLDIDSEEERLYQMIERENDRAEKRSDQHMNSLLFFLTCLASLSAVWDASCLLNEMYPFDSYVGSSLFGFRMVAYLLILLIATAILISRMLGRKR